MYFYTKCFSWFFILILGLNVVWTCSVRRSHVCDSICFLCLHRYREKSGHAGLGHQHKQTLSGCVWMCRESHHHCVWSPARAEQEEESADWRRDPGERVCLPGLFPWLQVSDRSGRRARLDSLPLDVGKEEGDGHCEDKHWRPHKPGKHV